MSLATLICKSEAQALAITLLTDATFYSSQPRGFLRNALTNLNDRLLPTGASIKAVSNGFSTAKPEQVRLVRQSALKGSPKAIKALDGAFDAWSKGTNPPNQEVARVLEDYKNTMSPYTVKGGLSTAAKVALGGGAVVGAAVTADMVDAIIMRHKQGASTGAGVNGTVSGATYSLTDSFVGPSFLSDWVHQAIKDPTNGRVKFVVRSIGMHVWLTLLFYIVATRAWISLSKKTSPMCQTIPRSSERTFGQFSIRKVQVGTASGS